MSNRTRIGLKLGLTLLLLAFLALRMDLEFFWEVLVSARWELVIGVIVIQLSTALLSIVRWRLIVNKFEMRSSWSSLTQITFIGYFFNLFLPSAFGGDFFRAYYLSKREERGLSTTLTTILLDRAGGLVSLLLIGTLALIFNPITVQGVPLLPIFVAMLVGFGAGIVVLFNDWTHRRLRRLLERFNREDIETKMELVAGGLDRLRRSPATILAALSISMVVQIAAVVMMWVAALAIGLEAPLGLFFSFIPVVNVTLAVPLTINGLGVRETVYYLLFAQIGVPMESAVTLSLLQFLAVVAMALPGAVAYTLYKRSAPDLEEPWRLDPDDVEGLASEAKN